MTPRVSAIIATFNYARFLPRAVESVLAQTYPNLECVIADDGSTDDTQEVLRPFGGRVRVLRRPHRGVSAARNAAIAASCGKYLAFLDGDDRWHARKIERQIDLLERRPELGCVGCGLEHLNPDGRVETLEGRRNDEGRLRTLRRIALRKFWIQGSGSGAVMRRSVLQRVGFFDEQLAAAEDWDMWLRVAAETGVDNVPDVLVSIDRHGTGVFRDARLVEENQWKVYRYAVARWPDVLTRADRRQMRAMILRDAARESRNRAGALGYYLRSLKEWPFNYRAVRDAAILGLRSSLQIVGAAQASPLRVSPEGREVETP